VGGVALSGATTVEQLQSKLAALDLDYEEELDRRLATLAEEPAQYWSARAALPWKLVGTRPFAQIHEARPQKVL